MEISGVDVQQDGERPTNMSSSEQKQQRVPLHTHTCLEVSLIKDPS